VIGPVIVERKGAYATYLAGDRDIARHASTRIAVAPSDLKNLPGHPLHDVDYVPGTVLLTGSSIFKKTGLLDEDYFFSPGRRFSSPAASRAWRRSCQLQAGCREDRAARRRAFTPRRSGSPCAPAKPSSCGKVLARVSAGRERPRPRTRLRSRPPRRTPLNAR
jgi:hypothetical protein